MAEPYLISVRGLCEFAAKHGDLDTRFTPSPTGQEGMAGHAEVQARRAPGCECEVKLQAAFGPLLVRGRADAYDPSRNLLEEIKTHRSELSTLPENQRALHWAQARVYGHMLCLERGLKQIELAIVYFDIGSRQETAVTETRSAEELADFFTSLCTRFLVWAEQEMAHQQARNAALNALAFPFAQFRPGQRKFAEAVYASCLKRQSLMAQAPTGIGKTLACLFPSLKAMGKSLIDRSFYLAAKTSGRQLALDALHRALPKQPVRVLELVARDKACVHPDKTCHGESCPLAKGFYDRLPAARTEAAQQSMLDQDCIATIAQRHSVCPYYLSSEMARWADVIIGDYNYYFDYGGMLYGLTLENQWQVQVLVDEAHNLLPRARAMYSAALRKGALAGARKLAPAPIKKRLSAINRFWRQAPQDDYVVLQEVPKDLIADVQSLISSVTETLAQAPLALDSAMLDVYFDAIQFARLAEEFGPHAICDISDGETICIRNIVPAPYLKPRLSAARSAVLFSATLSPWHFVSDSLGMPETAGCIDIPSPFNSGQLEVQLAAHISTRYKERQASVPAIVALMANGYRAQPGNYLAFFSSFDYLEQVYLAFQNAHPDIPVFRQTRAMPEAERAAFVGRFQPDARGIGFAVLGGAFSEGIDLPGARLIGAWIASLGLPQFNPVNEQFRQRMDALFGAGYDYTYLYPGLQKVVQAAGRVIRSEGDRGMVCLIDDRFAQPDVRALLPQWWQPRLIE
ncbi:ATP-dependent DNA helicase [Massilia sp. TS11]|uniref:ATP-dependent DNA helicase n=1 Tax=Massilia sp. TS11 TaxID=2908003 RepID=UPI001ED9CE90|nr:ATP-dependent DNA helicase [Massilia sp. TS11]MCG2584211.1 ATP-dependent DNA helicase [Massilia sp. TS11]